MGGTKAFASFMLLLSPLVAPYAAAQGDPTAATTQRADRAVGTLAAPPNLSFGAPLGSTSADKGFGGTVLVEGSADTKEGTATVNWKDAHDTLQFKAKSPLSGGVATPFTLDGLSANSSIDLSYSRLEFPDQDRAAYDALCDRIIEECKRGGGGSCTSSRCDLDKLSGADRAEARRILQLDQPIWFWGGGVTAARPTFEYLEAGTLAAQSVQKSSSSWNVRAGFFSSYFGFVIGSYSFVKEYRAAGAPQTICQPLAGTQATTCADAVIGPPTETKRSVATGEFRKFFSKSVAFAPSVQRDFKKKVTLVALPVYFIADKAGAPTGGLRLTWRSDTDATTVSVFIGAALQPR